MFRTSRRFAFCLLLAALTLSGAAGCEQRVTDAALRGAESYFFSLLDPANFLALLDDGTDPSAE